MSINYVLDRRRRKIAIDTFLTTCNQIEFFRKRKKMNFKSKKKSNRGGLNNIVFILNEYLFI